ncbi:hypothetical protein PBY51_018434 [Eleginops maclovinus]|uniref:Uncharacterized protein n=1 Tax=Eleginops maclovinus TaxID=56733 RepID=A0AAN8AXF0_ELEMC|nr:hypothetical protein PBY51_018434 [Eleginops maclovinus]
MTAAGFREALLEAERPLTVGGSQLDHVRHFFTVLLRQREEERDTETPTDCRPSVHIHTEKRPGEKHRGASLHLSHRAASVSGCRDAGRLRGGPEEAGQSEGSLCEDQRRRANQRAHCARTRGGGPIRGLTVQGPEEEHQSEGSLCGGPEEEHQSEGPLCGGPEEEHQSEGPLCGGPEEEDQSEGSLCGGPEEAKQNRRSIKI